MDLWTAHAAAIRAAAGDEEPWVLDRLRMVADVRGITLAQLGIEATT